MHDWLWNQREEREEDERMKKERERRGGVMAPSQCRMVLGMCEAAEVWKERVEFWEDVYGEICFQFDGVLFPRAH